MSLLARFYERWEVRIIYTLDDQPESVSESIRPRHLTKGAAQRTAQFLQTIALMQNLGRLERGEPYIGVECTIARVRR